MVELPGEDVVLRLSVGVDDNVVLLADGVGVSAFSVSPDADVELSIEDDGAVEICSKGVVLELIVGLMLSDCVDKDALLVNGGSECIADVSVIWLVFTLVAPDVDVLVYVERGTVDVGAAVEGLCGKGVVLKLSIGIVS